MSAEFLKQHDPDRYYASLVLKPPAREAVQALYAFSADIAAIRDRVSAPGPGEIRLQWWSDALGGTEHGAVRQNPLAAALLDTISRYQLPTEPLLRLIQARRFDLYQDPMPDLQSFEGYAGETVSVLYQLSAMILNDGRQVQAGDAAGHLGVAHALVGHLRAFGYNANQGRIFLPWSILEANGVREEEVFAGTVSEGLLAAFAQLYDLASEHLAHAQTAIAALPRDLRSAFAMVGLLPAQLRAVEAAGDSPFAAPPDLPAWRKLALLGWWGLSNG